MNNFWICIFNTGCLNKYVHPPDSFQFNKEKDALILAEKRLNQGEDPLKIQLSPLQRPGYAIRSKL
jgi:hypothetical protein